jgi:hypothetical protein
MDRFEAGLTLEQIAAEYGTTPRLMEEAVRFENRSGAIAA